jgi:hypothetical protein
MHKDFGFKFQPSSFGITYQKTTTLGGVHEPTTITTTPNPLAHHCNRFTYCSGRRELRPHRSALEWSISAFSGTRLIASVPAAKHTGGCSISDGSINTEGRFAGSPAWLWLQLSWNERRTSRDRFVRRRRSSTVGPCCSSSSVQPFHWDDHLSAHCISFSWCCSSSIVKRS